MVVELSVIDFMREDVTIARAFPSLFQNIKAN